MEIWINPHCSKCRSATTMLDDAGVDYTVRRYLDDPPTAEELGAVVARLGLEPWDVARTSEAAAAEAGLDTLPRDHEHRADWLAAMAAHPILIQRPIITADDGTTVVGRSEQAVRSVLP
jgi:arsenate reductase (glutaredoxin)